MYVALCLTAKAVQVQQVKQDRKSKQSHNSLVPDIARRGVAALAVLLSLASASHAASPVAKPTADKSAVAQAANEVAQTATENDPAAKPSCEDSQYAQAATEMETESSTESSRTDSTPAAEQTTVVHKHRQTTSLTTARAQRTPMYYSPSVRSVHRRTTQGRILLIGGTSRVVRSGSQA